jgi:hypothetical protein
MPHLGIAVEEAARIGGGVRGGHKPNAHDRAVGFVVA